VAIAGGCRVERFEFATSASSVSTAAPTSCDANVSSETPIWAPGGSGVLFDQMVETDGFRTDRTAVHVRDGAIMIGERPPARVDFGAVWSPDGRWLSGCDSNDRCFMMRPDGGRYRELTGPPSWSRDGSRVAVAGPDGNLLVGRGDGTDLQPIGAFPLPSSWSPDGTRFAFVRDGNVWVVGVDGSGTRAVTRFEIGGVVAATWSPVGDRLLVRRGSSWSIVAVADGASRPLDIPADAWEVTWSPDGEAISFELSPDHGDHVSTLIVQVADGRMVELRSADAATWSPDGRFLAVMSEGEISWTNEYGQEIHATVPVIEVVRADGSGRRTMWTADRDGLYSMTWLP
jgi:Tol biopolymer transport system component